MNMNTVSKMLMSAVLVTLTACSSFDTSKKRTATRKAPAVSETAVQQPAPATACVSCGAAGTLATINTAAGDSAGDKK